MTGRAAALLLALAAASLLAACGVRSDPAWPGGVWGDAPPGPASPPAEKAAPAGTP